MPLKKTPTYYICTFVHNYFFRQLPIFLRSFPDEKEFYNIGGNSAFAFCRKHFSDICRTVGKSVSESVSLRKLICGCECFSVRVSLTLGKRVGKTECIALGKSVRKQLSRAERQSVSESRADSGTRRIPRAAQQRGNTYRQKKRRHFI